MNRVVVASSDKAYGPHEELPYDEEAALQPIFPYDVSKAAADLIVRPSGLPGHSGDFRLIGRPALDALKQLPERHRFVRGLVSRVGFRQVSIAYERDARYAGRSKYPFSKLMKLAFDGIVSFSAAPLRSAALAGPLTEGFGGG